MIEEELLDEINKNGVRKYFEQYGTSIEVKKETSICSPRLSDSYVYYLVKGFASLTSLTKNGEEKVFLYFTQDRLLGFAPILMRHYRGKRQAETRGLGEINLFGIDTKTDCVFYRMPEWLFFELIEKDSKFQTYVMEVVTYNYVTVIKRYHDAQEENAQKRFCKWLLEFSGVSCGRRMIPDVFTFVEIAKYLNMHPVTISKLAAYLKNLGAIDKDKNGLVILDEEMIRSLVLAED